MCDNNRILSDGVHLSLFGSCRSISLMLQRFRKLLTFVQRGFKNYQGLFKGILTSVIFVMFPGTGSDNTNCLPNAKMTATKLILIQSVKPEYVATPLNHVPLPPLAFLKSGINNCLFFGILRLPCQSSDWTLLSFASLCTVCNIAVVEMPTHVPC